MHQMESLELKSVMNKMKKFTRTQCKIWGSKRIHAFEDRTNKLSILKTEEKRWKKTNIALETHGDKTTCPNIHIMGVPEGKETEKVAEKKVEETMAPNSPNSMKNINLPAQETQQTPHLINTQTHQSQTAESNKRKRTCYIHWLAVQLTATSHRNKSSEAAEWQPTGKPSPEPLFENEVKWRHPQINNNRDNC